MSREEILVASSGGVCTITLDRPESMNSLSLPVVEALAAKRILGGLPVSRLIPNDPSVENLLLLAATETATEAGMEPLVAALVRQKSITCQ